MLISTLECVDNTASKVSALQTCRLVCKLAGPFQWRQFSTAFGWIQTTESSEDTLVNFSRLGSEGQSFLQTTLFAAFFQVVWIELGRWLYMTVYWGSGKLEIWIIHASWLERKVQPFQQVDSNPCWVWRVDPSWELSRKPATSLRVNSNGRMAAEDWWATTVPDMARWWDNSVGQIVTWKCSGHRTGIMEKIGRG